MKLNEMQTTATPKRLNKVMESRFGFTVDYDSLTLQKATRLSSALGENINRIRQSYGVHTAEKNPKYMELLLVKEGLDKWMSNYRQLVESEMGKSEAILAAKDIVDTIQDTLEKISKIQTEQLPALIDTIRDQIGTAQAEQYKGQVSTLLGSIIDQLGQSRETADQAARALAGEQVEQPMDMGGAGMPAEVGPDLTGASDFDAEVAGAEGDAFGATDAAAGGSAELGRERR
jgi:hypothetical protein